MDFLSGLLVGLSIPAVLWAWSRLTAAADRRRVYSWLKANTKDVPHESHVDSRVIAKGTTLPDERVRRACMSDKRIHRYANGSDELWSVWRAEPQSIYETREPYLLESW